MNEVKRRLIIKRLSAEEENREGDLKYWLSLTPEERLDAVGECVREYLELRHEPKQGFRRVYRVLERE